MKSKASDGGIGGVAALFSLLGAIAGAALVLFMKTGNLKSDMSYADLAATLLAAVSVIVAIFGGILAIAALWGFSQMKQEAIDSATAACLNELKEQIENGALKAYILLDVERLIVAEIESDRMDRRINNRVDQIALGNPEDRFLEEEDGEEQ